MSSHLNVSDSDFSGRLSPEFFAVDTDDSSKKVETVIRPLIGWLKQVYFHSQNSSVESIDCIAQLSKVAPLLPDTDCLDRLIEIEQRVETVARTYKFDSELYSTTSEVLIELACMFPVAALTPDPHKDSGSPVYLPPSPPRTPPPTIRLDNASLQISPIR